jgi:hypothetical protein
MAVTEQAIPMLTAEQLIEVLRLVKGADSVELKLSVPDKDQRPAVAALGMDALQAQIRQVAFFDTPDLGLYDHGVVLRARRIQGKSGDSVVKLRPVVPEEVPAAVRKSAAFGIEVDAMPGGFVCSGSMKAVVDDDIVKAAFEQRVPLRKVFTKEQRALFESHAPQGVAIEGLTTLGPMNILKLKFTPPDFGRRLVAELWLYPDGSRILELSTKCAPGEGFEVAASTKAYLAGHGIDLSGAQQTKTRTALEYFSRALEASQQSRPKRRPPNGRARTTRAG